MSDIRIRNAEPSELAETAAVMVEAYSQYAAEVPDHLWKDYAAEIADVERRAPYSELIVAERDGEIFGAVTFYRDATLSDHKGWPQGYAEMRLLAVPPKARGLGVGRLLAEDCVRRAKENGNPVIGLHTSTLMHVAMGMYERMGFARAPKFDFKPDEHYEVMAIAYQLEL